jgi:hypothetical protein
MNILIGGPSDYCRAKKASATWPDISKEKTRDSQLVIHKTTKTTAKLARQFKKKKKKRKIFWLQAVFDMTVSMLCNAVYMKKLNNIIIYYEFSFLEIVVLGKSIHLMYLKG